MKVSEFFAIVFLFVSSHIHIHTHIYKKGQTKASDNDINKNENLYLTPFQINDSFCNNMKNEPSSFFCYKFLQLEKTTMLFFPIITEITRWNLWIFFVCLCSPIFFLWHRRRVIAKQTILQFSYNIVFLTDINLTRTNFGIKYTEEHLLKEEKTKTSLNSGKLSKINYL